MNLTKIFIITAILVILGAIASALVYLTIPEPRGDNSEYYFPAPSDQKY